jgi:transcriptional regulator with XRE-family HTH domain
MGTSMIQPTDVFMTQSALRPSEAIARRVKRERQRQGISAARLAERCAELGMPELTRDVLVNIEQGRRHDVSVDQLWTLAAALNVPPSLLQIPLGATQRFAVTPKITIHPHLALEWNEGEGPLVNTNRTTRLHPWADEHTLPWNEAAAPLWFYRRLRELQREVDRALPGVGQTWRDDAQREAARAALDRLQDHIEYMQHAGLDETPLVSDYEAILTKIDEED